MVPALPRGPLKGCRALCLTAAFRTVKHLPHRERGAFQSRMDIMEDVILVTGPCTLSGHVEVTGAKNSVLKLMAAVLLAEGRSSIANVPNIQDVWIMAELLRRLGCTVDYDVEAATVHIDVPA